MSWSNLQANGPGACVIESTTACPDNTASSTWSFSCQTNDCVLTCRSGYTNCTAEPRCRPTIPAPTGCKSYNTCSNCCSTCLPGYSKVGTCGTCVQATLNLGVLSVGPTSLINGSNTSSLMYINSTGVSIGTSTIPASTALNVVGATMFSENLSMINNKSIKVDNTDSNTTLLIGNYGDGQGFGYGASTTRTASLAVEGDVKANRLCIKEDCRAEWSDIQGTSYWTASSTDDIYNNNTGNVGIGDAEPFNKLSIIGNLTASGTASIMGNGSFIGNLGIGSLPTQTWARYIDLSGSGNSAYLSRTASVTAALIASETGTPSGTGFDFGYTGQQAAFGTLTNQPLNFITNGTSKMFLSADGNFGIGTTDPQGQFQVTGTGNIDDIPAMTSNTAPSPLTASASTNGGSTYQPWYAFNKVLSQLGWITQSGQTTGWLQLDLGAGGDRVVKEYSISAPNSAGYVNAAPKTWTLQGSNNASDWTILDTRTDVPSWSVSQTRQYTVANTNSYRYYRLNVTANSGYGAYLMIAELRLLVATDTNSDKFSVSDSFVTVKTPGGLNVVATGYGSAWERLQTWTNESGAEVGYIDKLGNSSMLTNVSGGSLTSRGTIANAGAQTASIPTLFVPSPGLNLNPGGVTSGLTAALIPIQYSPSLKFSAYTWDGVNKYQAFRNWVEPYVGGAINGRLKWENSRNSALEKDYYELMSLSNDGELNVLGQSFGPECLTNPDLTSGTSWTAAGGVSLVSNAATYSHNAAQGSLTQTAANLATPLKPNRWYRFTYTTSASTITVRAYIDETVTSAERIYLPGVTPAAGIGSQQITFKTNASPSDFNIKFTSAVGAITFDSFSLQEIQSGNIVANGLLTGGGTSGIKIDETGNVGINSTSPASTLDVNGNLSVSGSVAFSGPLYINGGPRLLMVDNAGSISATTTQAGVSMPAGTNGQTLRYGTSSWEATSTLSVNNSGNIGIGTTSPTTKLTVVSASPASPYAGISALSGNAGSYTSIGVGRTTPEVWLGVAGANNNWLTGTVAGDSVVLHSAKLHFGSAIAGAAQVTLDTGGNLGIGTTSPGYKLDVNGTARFTGTVKVATPIDALDAVNLSYLQSSLATTSNSLWTLDSNNLYASSTSWNVGIGTTSPIEKLTVAGKIYATDSIIVNGPSAQLELFSGDSEKGIRANSVIASHDQDTGTYIFAGDKLFVNEDYSTAAFNTSTSATVGFSISGSAGPALDVSNGKIVNVATPVYSSDAATKGYVDSTVLGAGGAYWTLNGNNLYASSTSWNLGIGTTSPAAKLHIYPTTGTEGLRVVSSDFSPLVIRNSSDGADLFRVYQNGNTIMNGSVGIGTNNPAASLEVYKNGLPEIRLTDVGNNYNLGDVQTQLMFYGRWYSGTTTPYTSGSIKVIKDNGSSSGGTAMAFFTQNNGSTSISEKMRINRFGYLGLGTSSPGYILDVNGGARFNGTVKVHPPTAGSDAVNKDYIDSMVMTGTTSAAYVQKTGDTMSDTLTFDSGTIIDAIDMGWNNIVSVNKITVGTIDPLYEIGGTKYSTYASAIVGGVKEEYVGKGEISQCDAKICSWRLNFAQENKGSDLWVWRKVVDFRSDKVDVLMTAYGRPATLSYEIVDNQIIFYANQPTRFSYRLVGARHDWRSWPTLATDQSEAASFILE